MIWESYSNATPNQLLDVDHVDWVSDLAFAPNQPPNVDHDNWGLVPDSKATLATKGQQ